MDYQIEYLDRGYLIKLGDQVYISQEFDPEKPFVDGVPQPFDTQDAAVAHATAVLATLQ